MLHAPDIQTWPAFSFLLLISLITTVHDKKYMEIVFIWTVLCQVFGLGFGQAIVMANALKC